MSRICPLFSGSTGNSTYISTSKGAFLVDAGHSCKQLCKAVENIGGDISDIRGIFITHEHSDHIKGLKTLVKNLKIPVFATKETLEACIKSDVIPAGAKLVVFDENTVDFGEIAVERFSTSHDCEGSSGYKFFLPDGKNIAVCTDLGIMTEEVRQSLSGCDTVLLESNHDIQMLKKGPYPPHLKVRILSDKGHLSNEACAAELPLLLKKGLKRIILGHISQKNNLPMLASSATRAALMDIGAQRDKDYLLFVAKPDKNEAIPL